MDKNVYSHDRHDNHTGDDIRTFGPYQQDRRHDATGQTKDHPRASALPSEYACEIQRDKGKER